MSKVRVAFERWDEGTLEEARSGKKLIGYQEIGCHMIFDIKMDGEFTRKARLVAGGHTTETPASITYSSVVSRESVRIAFLVAALNDLEVFAAELMTGFPVSTFNLRYYPISTPQYVFGPPSKCRLFQEFICESILGQFYRVRCF